MLRFNNNTLAAFTAVQSEQFRSAVTEALDGHLAPDVVVDAEVRGQAVSDAYAWLQASERAEADDAFDLCLRLSAILVILGAGAPEVLTSPWMRERLIDASDRVCLLEALLREGIARTGEERDAW